MGGYLSCFKKPEPDLIVKTPGEVRFRARKKPSVTEDFWSTSTVEMDNSTFPSKGSGSSISTLNHMLDSQGGAGNSNAPSEFVNHGLALWNQSRQRWVGKKRSEDCSLKSREPKLNIECLGMAKSLWLCSWNATYDSLLGSNKPFPQPVPLSEMVDFLVDIWEQEGLYD